jgi:DNA replicative helicase MCM subunit Mcm2 (Cdc46/Mcm family)
MNWFERLTSAKITCENCRHTFRVKRGDYSLVVCPNCWQYNRLRKRGVQNVSGSGSKNKTEKAHNRAT